MTGSSDFVYRDFFPTITNPQIGVALNIVSAEWSGIFELWADLDETVKQRKRENLLQLLVASWLADNYPGSVVGGISNGALPLAGKGIDGVSLQYKDLENVPGELKVLTTNQWGIQALRMYLGAPERFKVYR